MHHFVLYKMNRKGLKFCMLGEWKSVYNIYIYIYIYIYKELKYWMRGEWKFTAVLYTNDLEMMNIYIRMCGNMYAYTNIRVLIYMYIYIYIYIVHMYMHGCCTVM
jgi:hypothetical protein